MERVTWLNRKYKESKTRGRYGGGERPAPKKHRNKNPKAHDQSKQRQLVLVLNKNGKFTWRQI